MKFLDLIFSLFTNSGRRKGRIVHKVKTAQPKTAPAADAMSCFRSGIQNYGSAKYQAAIGDFTQAITFRSNFHQAFYNRGLSRLKIEDNQGADLDFTKAIEIYPVYAKAYLNRGIAKNRLGDADGAQEDFQKSVEIDPKLYPLFTVRKIKIRRNKKAADEDILPEVSGTAGQVNEFFAAFSAEGTEESRVLKAEEGDEESRSLKAEEGAEEDGFMNPLVLESEKDEYSALSSEDEEESELSVVPGGTDESQEEADAEHKFEELVSELVSEDEPLQNSSEEKEEEKEEVKVKVKEEVKEEEEDYFAKLLESEIEKEILQKLSGVTDKKVAAGNSQKSLKDEKKEGGTKEKLQHAVSETKDDSKKKTGSPEEMSLAEEDLKTFKLPALDGAAASEDKTGAAAENITKAENQEKEVKKEHFEEAEDFDDAVKMPLQAAERVFDDNESFEYIEEPEDIFEKQMRAEAEVSDDEFPEDKLSRNSERNPDEMDLDISDRSFTVELPEQKDLKRILGEIVPDIRINYARGFFIRASQKYEAGDLEGAVQDYSNAIESYPKFSQAYLQRGIIGSELNDLENAIADYTKSIEYSQRNPTAYFKRAMANQKLGKNREALADFTKAIIFEPRNPQLYILRGMLRYEMGQVRSAFADWSKAETLGSKHAGELLQKYVLQEKVNQEKSSQEKGSQEKGSKNNLPKK